MKSQVVTPRAGRGGTAATAGKERAVTAGGIVQRPAARNSRAASGEGRATGRLTLQGALGFVPLAAKILFAAGIGMLVFLGYRAATSAAFFQAGTIDVEGASRASKEEIGRAVRRSVATTGVWSADLDAISSDLRRQPWVRTAVVSRVLPSGLRVRVTERTPRAVVRAAAGRLMWVDDDGVTLGTAASTDNLPPFFIRGWDESGSELAGVENRERVAKYLELSRDWDATGHSARVSEVNLDDLRDVRVQLAGDDAQIEVRLGKEDLSTRLDKALQVLDEQRRTPRGAFITYIDLTQGTRAVIGSKSLSQSTSERIEPSSPGSGGSGGSDTPIKPASATAGNESRDVAKRGAGKRRGGTTTAETVDTRGTTTTMPAASAPEKNRGRDREANGATTATAERPRRAT